MVKLRDLLILITWTLAGLVKTSSKDSVYSTNVDDNKESTSNFNVLETLAETQLVESIAYGADDRSVYTFESIISYQKNQTHPLRAEKHQVSLDHVIDESYQDAVYEQPYNKQHPKNIKRQHYDNPIPGPTFQIKERGGKPLAIQLNTLDYLIVYGAYNSTEFMYATMYDNNGNITKDEFVVYSGDVEPGSYAITSLNEHGFVIIWRENSPANNVRGQRFDNDGDKQGNVFEINNSTREEISVPGNIKVSNVTNNEFVVVYAAGSSSQNRGIYAQRYDVSCSKVGNEILVKTGKILQHDITSLSNGFVITWVERTEDITPYSLKAQLFNVSGSTFDDESQVWQGADCPKLQVLTLRDDSYLICFVANRQLYAQHFDANGYPLTDIFHLLTSFIFVDALIAYSPYPEKIMAMQTVCGEGHWGFKIFVYDMQWTEIAEGNFEWLGTEQPITYITSINFGFLIVWSEVSDSPGISGQFLTNKNSLQIMLDEQLNAGSIYKPWVEFYFEIGSCPFPTDCNQLDFVVSQPDGSLTPSWLKYENHFFFDTGFSGYIFSGTPEENETVSILFGAFDQNSTYYKDEFTLFKDTNYTQKSTISANLQESLEVQWYEAGMSSTDFVDGQSFQFFMPDFSYGNCTSIYKSYFRKIGDDDWKSVGVSWLKFDGTSLVFSGFVKADNSTVTYEVEVHANDGYGSSGVFTFQVLSMFKTEKGILQVQSQTFQEIVNIKVVGAGVKLSVLDCRTARAFDSSSGAMTTWQIIGRPDDINCSIENIQYRNNTDRRVLNDIPIVTFKTQYCENSMPLSSFNQSKPMTIQEISNQNGYIEQFYTMQVSTYFNNTGQPLYYTQNLLKSPSDADFWLRWDEQSATLSGVPKGEEEIGTYRVQITATDEYGHSKSQEFTIEVDYTDWQKFISILKILLPFVTPLLAILGLWRYRAAIYNITFKARYQLVPLVINTVEQSCREIQLLSGKEKDVARKIVEIIKKNPLEVNDLFTAIKNAIETLPNGEYYYEFENLMSQPGSPVIEIDGTQCHAKFIYDYIYDGILKDSLDKHERRALKIQRKQFKLENSENYGAYLLNTLELEISQNYADQLSKRRDAWTGEFLSPLEVVRSNSELSRERNKSYVPWFRRCCRHRKKNSSKTILRVASDAQTMNCGNSQNIKRFLDEAKWSDYRITDTVEFRRAFESSVLKHLWWDMSIKSDFQELDELINVNDTQPRTCWTRFIICIIRKRLFRYLKWHLERAPFDNSRKWINNFDYSDEKVELHVRYDEKSFKYDPIVQIKDKTGYIIAEFEVIVDKSQNQETKRSESYSCNVALVQLTKEIYPQEISIRVDGKN